MAVFDEIRLPKDADLPTLKKRLYKFAEDLKYTFGNLDEDNFSREFIDHMKERDGKLREISFDEDGLKIRFEDFEKGTVSALEADNEKISMLVSRGDVVNTLISRLEIYGEKIEIKGPRLVIDATNMQLTADGHVNFTGKITGGSINIKDRFIVAPDGTLLIDGSLETGLLNPRTSVTCGSLEVENNDDYIIAIAGDLYVEDEVYIGYELTCQGVRITSDGRLKEVTGEILPARKIIEGLRPVSYTYTKSGVPSMGYIAQEVHDLEKSLGGSLPMSACIAGIWEIPMDSFGAVYAAAIQDNQRRIERLFKALGKEA